MTYPFDLHLQSGTEEYYAANVSSAFYLYRVVEFFRIELVTAGRRLRGPIDIEMHIDGYEPVVLHLDVAEKALQLNGYSAFKLEQFLEDALTAQGMFQHLSTEPRNFRTTWEDLL